MAVSTLSAALVCTAIICCWTFVSCVSSARCDIYQWDQLGPPGVLQPYCSGFPIKGFWLLTRCSVVRDMLADLSEVPMDVDTLCLGLNLQKIPRDSFSNYQNLTTIFLYGLFYASAGAFNGIDNLWHLGLQGEHAAHGPSIYLDDQVFQGLENLTHLDLRNTAINTAFQQNLFKPLQKIKTISLYNNDCLRISSLTRMVMSLASLEVLEITRNGIIATRALDCLEDVNVAEQPGPARKSVFSPRISVLDLTGNKLRNVEENSLCNFPFLTTFRADATSLKVIELLGSGIQSIDVLSLNGMINVDYLKIKDVCWVVSKLKVRNLTLTQNLIASLPIEAFEGCSNLLSLNMSDNLLMAFTYNMTKKLFSLRSLILSVNKIYNIELCPPGLLSDPVTNLTHLDLSSNRITNAGSSCFSCLQNLVTLDLSRNHIVSLEKDTFVGLHKLQSLNLEFNKLFLLKNFYFVHLRNVKQLGLWGNILLSNNRSLEGVRWLQELSITFENRGDLHITQKQLTTLTVEGPVTTLTCVNNCSSLEVLHIRSQLIYIQSCIDLPFKYVKELHLIENEALLCLPIGIAKYEGMAFPSFANVERLHYSSPEVISILRNSSPLNDSLPRLHHLRHLHLGNLKAALQKRFLVPQQLFWNLTGLRTLTLEDSGIEHFTATMFRDLVSLELLILKSQSVKTLEEGLFDQMGRLKYIYLKAVQLNCLCEQAWMGKWLAFHPYLRTPMLGAQTCSLGPQEVKYLHFLETDCNFQVGYSLFIGTFSFHMLFLLTALLYQRVHWYLLYLFYKLRTWWNYRGRRDRQKQYEFDIFISYSSCDEAWVVHEFLPNLEEKGPPFFKVCLHGRDFEVGKDIMDNITDSMYQSRWTVCVISRNYLRSNWCSLEMRMATYRLLAERKDALVMVFLEKISMEYLSHYHQVAKLVKQKTYLEWEEDLGQQPLFWARLRKAIGEDGTEGNDDLSN